MTMVGIIGGSGFYQFLKGREISVSTPYGKPSDKILICSYTGKKIAFLPRHGKRHQYPPHKVPYRANLYALKKLGCERVISGCAVGSLRAKIRPGDFVISREFIDQTKGREDTYYNGPEVVHISLAPAYCPELRKLAIASCQKLKIPVHKTSTILIIEGPRYATRAESKIYREFGADIINMTQYPEVTLARELEMCFVNISLVTDYDQGLAGKPGIKPVTAQEVIRVFKANNEKLRKLILEMVKNMPAKRECSCGMALEEAIV